MADFGLATPTFSTQHVLTLIGLTAFTAIQLERHRPQAQQIGTFSTPPAASFAPSPTFPAKLNPEKMRMKLPTLRLFLLTTVVLPCPLPASAQTSQTLLSYGLDTYNKTVSSLLVPNGNGLFAETASLNGARSGGDSGFSYVWPASTQMRVYDALVRIDPTTYTPILRQFSDQLDSHYWTSSTGGYRSGVSSGATQFYDDNAHIAVALMTAYNLTHDPVYLTRATATYNFVLSGEDDSPQSGGGGIYFNTDRSFKDSAATLQGARAALLLYQATGQQHYLDDATRLYTWEKNTLQQPDGLFGEKYYVTGPQAGTISTTTLVNFTSFGLDDNILFYKVTGNSAYLTEAERIANRTLTRYFSSTTGAIQDEGFWSFELVNALDDLTLTDNNPLYPQKIQNALLWLHDNGQDPNGHYGTLWGRAGTVTTPYSSWNLNDMAPVAESYLYTSLAPEPAAVLPVLALSLPLLGRRRAA